MKAVTILHANGKINSDDGHILQMMVFIMPSNSLLQTLPGWPSPMLKQPQKVKAIMCHRSEVKFTDAEIFESHQVQCMTSLTISFF